MGFKGLGPEGLGFKGFRFRALSAFQGVPIELCRYLGPPVAHC